MATAKRGQFFDLLDILKLFPTLLMPKSQDLAIFPPIYKTDCIFTSCRDRRTCSTEICKTHSHGQTYTHTIHQSYSYLQHIFAKPKDCCCFLWCPGTCIFSCLYHRYRPHHLLNYYNRQLPGQMFPGIATHPQFAFTSLSL